MAFTKKGSVYIDVTINGYAAGRMIFELFYDEVPKTCENFRRLCTGENGSFNEDEKNLALHYLNCHFYKIVPGKYVESGDISHKNGVGGYSIFGKYFNDEKLIRKVDSEGLLVMGSHAANKNSSKFLITLKEMPELDGSKVVFGRLIYGMDVLKKISKVIIDSSGKPKVPVRISDVGEMDDKKLFITKDLLGPEGIKKIRDANATNRLFFEVAPEERPVIPVPMEGTTKKTLEPLKQQAPADTSIIKDAICEIKQQLESANNESQKSEVQASDNHASKNLQTLNDIKARINQKRTENSELFSKEILENSNKLLIKREKLDAQFELRNKIFSNLEKKNLQKYPFLNDPANLQCVRKGDLYDILKTDKPKEKFGWDGFLISV